MITFEAIVGGNQEPTQTRRRGSSRSSSRKREEDVGKPTAPQQASQPTAEDLKRQIQQLERKISDAGHIPVTRRNEKPESSLDGKPQAPGQGLFDGGQEQPSSDDEAQQPKVVAPGGFSDTSGLVSHGQVVPQAQPVDSGYTVKSGDTLSQIAQNAGIPLNDLLSANPGIADPNLIQIGQVITLPGTDDAPKISGGERLAPPQDIDFRSDEFKALPPEEQAEIARQSAVVQDAYDKYKNEQARVFEAIQGDENALNEILDTQPTEDPGVTQPTVKDFPKVSDIRGQISQSFVRLNRLLQRKQNLYRDVRESTAGFASENRIASVVNRKAVNINTDIATEQTNINALTKQHQLALEEIKLGLEAGGLKHVGIRDIGGKQYSIFVDGYGNVVKTELGPSSPTGSAFRPQYFKGESTWFRTLPDGTAVDTGVTTQKPAPLVSIQDDSVLTVDRTNPPTNINVTPLPGTTFPVADFDRAVEGLGDPNVTRFDEAKIDAVLEQYEDDLREGDQPYLLKGQDIGVTGGLFRKERDTVSAEEVNILRDIMRKLFDNYQARKGGSADEREKAALDRTIYNAFADALGMETIR